MYKEFFLKPGGINNQNQTESIIWSLPLLGLHAHSPWAWCLQVVMSVPSGLVSISRAGWYSTKFTKNITKLKIGLHHMFVCYCCYFHGTRACAVHVHACYALGGVWVCISTSWCYSSQALFFAVLFTNDSFLNVVPWSVFQLTEIWRSASCWWKITGREPEHLKASQVKDRCT